jgi:hypothetical protein
MLASMDRNPKIPALLCRLHSFMTVARHCPNEPKHPRDLIEKRKVKINEKLYIPQTNLLRVKGA